MDPSNKPRTYVAGEDEGRLAEAAGALGLRESRRPLRPVREAVTSWFMDSTLTAARMHSVGALAQNERIDSSGTLHYISVRRRRRVHKAKDYGTLTDLFVQHPPPDALEMEEGEESEEEEEVEEDQVEGGSLNAAVFGIIKGTVGPAILYLPRGFLNSGYVVAIPAMLFATFMFIYNAYRLLECWKVESDRNHKVAARMEEVRALLQSSTVGGPADDLQSRDFTPKLLTYPELARRALGPFAFLVEFGIASMQFGVCLTYLIFVPQNLHECALALTGVYVPKIYFLVAMVLIEIPMSWIRDIRKLTPTNVLATLLIAYGLCSVLTMAFVSGFQRGEKTIVFLENAMTMPAFTESWFIFIGTSFFMMEGSITLIVPLQEAVFLKEDKDKFPRINQITTTWIVVFYIVFSMICAAAFGDGIKTALTASLKGSLAVSVQFAYSIAVIFTFPLQAFPALEVACKSILGDARRQDDGLLSRTMQRSILATLLTCMLGVIAVCAINYLGNVVSILGSLFGIPLALVFPPLMHNRLVKDSSKMMKVSNYCVVCVGFLAMAAASLATIENWNKGAEE